MGNGRIWDYARAQDEKHKRPDIDFSFVRVEHVQGYNSLMPVIHIPCGYGWYATPVAMLMRKSGCPRCTSSLLWTLQRLLTEGSQRWPTTDFSLVSESDLRNSHSPIQVRCKNCGDQRQTCIHYLVSGYGCPTCSGNKRWCYERLFIEIVPSYLHRYYFGNVRSEDVYNLDSPFWISSYECGHSWQTSVTKLKLDHGCPSCSLTSKWTYEQLIEVMKGRPDIDTSLISSSDEIGWRTPLTWKCSKIDCGYVWQTNIGSVITKGSGCPDCAGCAPYTYDRLMEKMSGRTDVDLRLITREHDFRAHGKLPFICTKCGLTFETHVGRMVRGESHCPCSQSKSKGEENVCSILTQANIPFEREVVLPSLPRKRFDFRFTYNNRVYLLEFDGEQHFTQNDFHHRDEAHFRERQVTDVVKSQHAYQNGYFLIRIDYTQIDNIREHLHRAVTSTERYYLSNSEMYSYLFTTPVPSDTIVS